MIQKETPAEKLIHKSILQRCDDAGIKRNIALDVADQAAVQYRQNKFSKASKLVDEAVTKAKKLTIKKAK